MSRPALPGMSFPEEIDEVMEYIRQHSQEVDTEVPPEEKLVSSVAMAPRRYYDELADKILKYLQVEVDPQVQALALTYAIMMIELCAVERDVRAETEQIKREAKED